MHRKPWFWIASCLTFTVLVLAFTPGIGSRLSSLGSVWQELTGSDKHHLCVAECGKLALEAPYNHAVIERAATYVADHGSGTGLYLKIARIAAEADCECPRLEQVLDLAVMKRSEIGSILNLAETASRLETPEQEARWQSVYEATLASADYPSVEAALAALAPPESGDP